MLDFLLQFFTNYGYLSVAVVLLMCGFGVPIPEDIVLISSGIICAISLGKVNLLIMLFVALFGVLAGDIIVFTLGYVFGTKVLQLSFVKRFVTDELYSSVQNKVMNHSNKLLFLARFMPGVRVAIYLIVGTTKQVSYIRFILCDLSAATISVPILVYLGFYFSNNIGHIIHYVHYAERYILSSILLIFIAGFVFLGKK